jgi:sialic acid synthase SpsE/quercetin dioxygenase-like cupin family protein
MAGVRFDFKDLIIFEMANNHQGSLEHGLRIIDEISAIARRHGLRAAIKLQYRDLATFIHPNYVGRDEFKQIARFTQTRLSWDQLHNLVSATHDRGMLAVVTCFDEPSIAHALNHGADVLKIASCSSMDWPLLGSLASTAKPLICSTGGCAFADIDKIVTFFEHRDVDDLALMHCVGIYPTDDHDQQLQLLRRMIERYPHCAVGYSGHETPGNLRVVVGAVAMGAEILERHVGVPTDASPLNAYSMSPVETSRWVEEVIAARAMCGLERSDRALPEIETQSLRALSRGVWAKVLVPKGAVLTRDAVFFALPTLDGQTTTREYLEIMIASRDYGVGEPILERRRLDPIGIMRGVVHEAKGMLREARIVPGKDYEIELSHHYGMENFRRYGATIVNIVNREYCKKLIVLLPGQTHPSHAHRKKEETFQIAHGELEFVLDGVRRIMAPGDTQLVIRGQYHSFSSRTGCVFEEISTTHIKGDSVYEDAAIARLDPVQRKTRIDVW